MGLLLAVCALLLLGPTASLWAALGWLLAVLLGPRLEPAAALAMLGARPIARHQFPRGYAILDQLSRRAELPQVPDRKSTRLNSSHVRISYAVFCLKKKITK